MGSSLIDEDINTPVVDEQVVEEQASDFDVGGSGQFHVRGSSDVRGYDVRGYKNIDVGGSGQFDDEGYSDVKVVVSLV
uniref:Uncharacterized protein n=1 Tax=Tanacetum cinerariifolium TaxID=118510 RepID=A0A6L2KMF5_TANCI|nr:hypothetical protein [Tanacetum cinerariifolium]